MPPLKQITETQNEEIFKTTNQSVTKIILPVNQFIEKLIKT